MKAGRKPTITFSELVKLRSIQAAFGKDSPEEAQFWEQASTSAKLRRAIKRGKCIKPKPRKWKCYKDAHNAANRAYYQRHKDKVSEKNRRWYERNKERKKAYYAEHKEHIRTYYKEWYERQKAKKNHPQGVGFFSLKARHNTYNLLNFSESVKGIMEIFTPGFPLS